ncbi:unnamed protein product [Linum trigynum]|uniref:Uncharacterized protein n=1 Tax=Linum trigynum TaxID=586398 RepID=A0AAV2CC91_9ROSI
MGWKAAGKLIRHWKVLRGDNVMIIRGKDKGESGCYNYISCEEYKLPSPAGSVTKHIKAGEGHEESSQLKLHFMHQMSKLLTHSQGDPARLESTGQKDTPMDLVLEKAYDCKTGKCMPDL